jgi:hypothetical protein
MKYFPFVIQLVVYAKDFVDIMMKQMILPDTTT